MGACVQCGTVGKPTDKFCNVCGTPLPQAAPPPAAPSPGYGPPPQGYAPAQGYPPPQGYGAPPPVAGARCQMGHDIAPGANYCAQGHPIALDQMQFPADPYGGQGAYAPAPQQAYGTPPGYPPPQAPPGYGAPPPAAPQGYTPPPAAAYAPVPSPGFGTPQGYAPPAAPAPAPYAAPAPAAPQPAPSPMAATAQPPYGADPSKARVLRGFLVAYGINPSGDFWALTGGRHVLGRLGPGEGIDISLQDPTISSRHAVITVDGNSGSIVLEDTGSTNGTFVNDEHIGFNGRRDLRDGDRLRFGGYTTIVKVIGRV
jgi:hypothetical protein